MPPPSENADGVFEPFAINAVRWVEYPRGERFKEAGRVPVKLTGAGCRQDATLGNWEGVDADSNE